MGVLASFFSHSVFNVRFKDLGELIDENMGIDIVMILPIILRCAVVSLCLANFAAALYHSRPFIPRRMSYNRASEPFHDTDNATASLTMAGMLLAALFGSPRAEAERRKLLKNAVNPLIFQHTILRKHPFVSSRYIDLATAH